MTRRNRPSHRRFGVLFGAISVLCTTPATARPPSTADIRAAQRHVQTASAYFDRGEWEQAITQYLLALGLVPDTAPIVWNVARAYEAKGDPEQAIAWFQRFMALDVPREHLEAARARLRALQSARPQPLEAPAVRPERQVELTAPSAPSTGAQVPGSLDAVAVPTGPDLRLSGWITLGAGLGVLAAGTALSVLSQEAYDTVRESEVTEGVTQLTRADADAAQARGDTLGTTGLVLLGVGGAAVVTGLILALTSGEPNAAADLQPLLAPSADGLVLGATARF